jgi:hypothetical protein
MIIAGDHKYTLSCSRITIPYANLCDGCPELGVEFLHQDDAFKARMVEQVCFIENYKKAAYRAEGRLLSSAEAAMEWITKYASGFSDPEA